MLLEERVLVCKAGSKRIPRGEAQPNQAPAGRAETELFQLTNHMKASHVSRKAVTASLGGLLIPAIASAHPGHYGHGVDPSSAVSFLQDHPGLDQWSLAVAVTCLALFFIRNTYRKLP